MKQPTALVPARDFTAEAPLRATHNTRLQIVDARWGRVYVGTSIGYSLYNGECPVESLVRCLGNRHETVWCSSECAVLSATPLPEEPRTAVRYGDHLRIEGRLFRLTKPGFMDGDHPRLVDVTPPEVAATLGPACTVRNETGTRQVVVSGRWPTNPGAV